MKKRILRICLPLLILMIFLGLTACSSDRKSIPTEVTQSNEQDGGDVQRDEEDVQEDIEKNEEDEPQNQVDRYSEIIDTSKDDGKLAIYFLDLPVIETSDNKSGDSSLLISPDGKVMLVDAGLPECAPHIISFLEKLGIEKIDYFVASHPHIDHIGGFASLASKINIGKVYRNDMAYTTKTYKNFVNALEAMDIPVEYLKEGDEIAFGEDIQVKIYNPKAEYEYPKDYPNSSTQFINDNSIVMKLIYGKSTILYAGDIYRTRERDLLMTYGDELQADVIKANHHGGGTSNSNRWIKGTQPKIVVAMRDKIDSMSVYENFVKQGATYYNAALNGEVKILIDNEKNYTVINQFDNWNNEDT